MTEKHAAVSGLSALRAAQDRDFGSEGIPMVLALFSVGAPAPTVGDPAVLADGGRIAALLSAVRADAFASQREGDLGCLISSLQATSVIVNGQ
ncbi:hypothetical protein M6D93_18340 [Jatrophihabitans telluris]|uniref:Uncharacterized protein n=1 Tax=Jatrophihabitans telluris TaxID=2038343 RepID=A0ABY4QZF2_9ACTN|nr:hypothetical protein [Jatrophihabitans telluris]UQX88224.1 hypothetical protein M6D93_18340 [Jatrophihabitans telluris]